MYKWIWQEDTEGNMADNTKFYLVEKNALPPVIVKVAEAMQSMETGRAATIADAVKAVGISRSAFYKYRDSVRPFFDKTASEMLTMHMVLEDAPGMLSSILSVLADKGADVLTINQSIPIGGIASVTVSVTLGEDGSPVGELVDAVRAVNGVTKLEIVAG